VNNLASFFHFSAETFFFFHAECPPVFFTLTSHRLYRKLFSVAIVPICGRARVTATGLQWSLSSAQLELGRYAALIVRVFGAQIHTRFKIDINVQSRLQRHRVCCYGRSAAAHFF
jgi:hypothetical protein